MAVTREQIEALETFFLSAQIPQQLEFNKAITLRDVATHINEKINMLRGDALTERVADSFYDHLVTIKETLERQQG